MGKKTTEVDTSVGEELFKRYVEPGRVCVVEYGPDAGKVCVIVDIVSLNRVLIDGAGLTGVCRQSLPLRRLSLSDVRIKLNKGSRTSVVKKAMEKQNALDTFNLTAHGKKLILRARKAKMTDFDRFKLIVLKRKRNQLMKKHIATLSKTK
eukprot:GHVQ01005979.1.p1 GENE.GHVQ01005979.1~~GHVQ01005979.1.p1  ORF type:complete len:150 (-),score=21.64 GHVQ01005979.1:669-1118(-)